VRRAFDYGLAVRFLEDKNKGVYGVLISASYFDRHVCLLAVLRAFGASEIFSAPLDYKFFLQRLRYCKSFYGVSVFSFCLMPSSIYLSLGGPDCRAISLFLTEVNESFCDFVRVRDQGRKELQILRSRLLVLEDERALFDISAFVDALPVSRGMVERAEEYEWSSFRLKAFGIENGVVEKMDMYS